LGKVTHALQTNLHMFDTLYTKCGKGWVLAKTKAQSIIIMALL